MSFQLIDRTCWPREPYFQHYFSAVPCSYSLTARLDITALRRAGLRLYPTLLFALTQVVNRHPEFRTALDPQGRLGIFDRMYPSYTVFSPRTETFTVLWTECGEDYATFCAAYARDTAAYAGACRVDGKPGAPDNLFSVSMLPWTSFEGFHLHLPKGEGHLLPIFTFGRFSEAGCRCTLPLAVQVHHAVCDGFHLSRFLHELQALLDRPESL